ncbi:MAG: MOSC domain-containing protein [Acidobacteriota bacterium]|nr:MOSC domain-containing protein [Acidobacteriota bacterium]
MFVGTVKEIWRHPVKSMAGEKLEACTVDSLGIPGDRGWALRDEQAKEITNGKRIPLLMHCAARYRQQPANGTIPHVDITFPDGSGIASDDPRVNARLSEVFGKDLTLWPRQPPTNKQHYRRNAPAARLMSPLMKVPGFRSLLPMLTKLPNLDKPLREAFSREPNEPIPDISILPAEVLEFTSPLGTYFDAFPIHLLTSASLATMAQFNPSAVWDPRRFRPNFFIETAEGIEGLIEANWAGRRLRVGTVELKCEIPCVRCGMTSHSQKELPKDPSVLRSIVKDADQNLGVYASVVKNGNVREGDAVELV